MRQNFYQMLCKEKEKEQKMSESNFVHIAAQYGLPAEVEILAGNSGMNNTTRIVRAAGQKYIMRVYETHRDIGKVRCEHAVLRQLGEMQLTFAHPVPLVCGGSGEGGERREDSRKAQDSVEDMEQREDGSRRVHDASGVQETVAIAPDGKLAAMFHYIAGERPQLQTSGQLESFGRVVGQLGQALSQIHLPQMDGGYRPYYELDQTHPSCPPAVLAEFCSAPPAEFIDYADDLAFLRQWCLDFAVSVPQLKRLPHQLIHGDLNASNMLADASGRIAALLDFEFVTPDLRVMEAAVCLSDLLEADESGSIDETVTQSRFASFMLGWRSAAQPSKEELAALPLLVQLRRIDVFVHFLGRYFDGVDDAAIVQRQIREAARTVGWLQSKGAQLASLS
ncbi:hypothetical protein EBB07_24820 [Paenibacillaceae bacterium]|nr:hypothetical protein EBB07_24820 [Paenibacillaceae bacterium]